MSDFRLPLESEGWMTDESMQKARRLIPTLLDGAIPTVEKVEDFISQFDWADYVERGYYFALPYLVDYLVANRSKILPALQYFCHPLMTPDGIPDDCQRQIRGVRQQIADLLLYALEQSSSRDEFDYSEQCYQYIATIAAVYMESYVGIQITRLPDEGE